MIKRIFLFLAALAFAQVAFAQAWDGPGAQIPSYPTSGGAYTGIVGDGSTSQGGNPPALSIERPDIASGFTVSNWIAADPSYTSSAGAENKFRFTCNATAHGTIDMILYKGIKGASHEHTFAGAINFDENSDYDSLRTSGGNSTCSGGPVNRSLYWETSVKKELPTGAKVTLKPDWITFYYVHANSDTGKYYRLVNGIQFIGGKWPTDLNDSARKAEIPSGFAWVTDGFTGNGMGWYCENATGNPKPSLRNADNTDPWGGTCTAGNRIYAQLLAPTCWDGKNTKSPNGRDHLRYFIRHTNSGALVCPDGWWRIPAIEAKVFFSHNGWSDYSTWYCSSDAMNAAARPCETMHFDYIQAWDPDTLDTLQIHCLGIPIGANPSDPHQCDSGTISTTQRLKGGISEASPDGSQPNPIIQFNNYRGSTNSVRFFPLLPGATGSGTFHHGVPPTQ